MKNLVFFLIAASLLLGCSGPATTDCKEAGMALDFTAAAAQRITFSGATLAFDKSVRSWLIWINEDTRPDVVIARMSAAGVGRQSVELNVTAGYIRYHVTFSGSAATWNVNSDVIPADGANHLLGISYDGTSISNNPAIYVDGVAKTVAVGNAPIGTISTGEDEIQIGGHPSFGTSMDGRMLSILYFSRILTATEMLDAYKSRLAVPNRKNLAFAPILWGAKGLNPFDGQALAAGNTIYDPINKVAGVPTGNPVGVVNKFLCLADE